MGLLDRFRKEEHIHFTRDENNKVVKVDREYTDGRGQPIQGPSLSKQLFDKAKLEKKLEKREWKKKQREAYREAFNKARIQRLREQGRCAGRMTLSDRFNCLQPIQSNYQIRQNYNPIGNIFDSGLSKPKSHKTKRSSSGGGKTHYAIIGGKAYPIAKTSGGKSKKKGKGKKKKSGMGFGGFDPMDNWGFM